MRNAIALYESLARWQWWRRKLRRSAPEQGLEMRKQLLPTRSADRPADGEAGLDRWLQHKVGDRAHTRVLDLGCGFGISLLRWLRHGSKFAHGVTPSGYQVRRAEQIVAAAGEDERCTFACRDLSAPTAQRYDLVLAIEALGHAPDLDAVLRAVRQQLDAAGTFVWVEDLLHEAMPNDADVVGLAHAWRSPLLREVAEVRSAVERCGLRLVDEIDLTEQVARREPIAIARSLSRARRLRSLVPLVMARDIGDAFCGGYLLERLYARGATCYRTFVIEPGVAR